MVGGNPSSERTRAAIYARISQDPRGLEDGVSRQIEDCEKLAVNRGWAVVARYTDNDISAFSGQGRPQYDALMAAALGGEFDVIVTYGLSRLWRSRQERAVAIGQLGKARVDVALVKGSDLDLSSAAGRMYADVLGSFDTAESEIKSERVARAAQQRAREGRANGACAFGWTRVYERDPQGRVLSWRDEVDEPAANVVRGIVRDLLAGITLRAITARLNQQGIAAPLGGRWIPSSVRKLAVRDLNVGVRTHRVRTLQQGDQTTEVVETFKGAWDPIIDEADHQRVKDLLADPRRRTQKAAARTHLLTFGVGRCGCCGGPLVVSRKGPQGKKTSLYVCKEKGCVGRRKEWVDELVVATVVERLSRPDAAGIFEPQKDSGSEKILEEVARLRRKLDEAADLFVEDKIDRDTLERITAQTRPLLATAERRARPPAGVPPAVGALIDATATRAAWDELCVSQQRAVLEALGLEVVIHKARGGPGFKPESIEVVWAVSR